MNNDPSNGNLPSSLLTSFICLWTAELKKFTFCH